MNTAKRNLAIILICFIMVCICYCLDVRNLKSEINGLNKKVKSLTNAQLESNDEIRSLTDENKELVEANESLQRSLDQFTNPVPYNAAAVPTYDSLPLNYTLQLYTYEMCQYYKISDYYEVVLALMWHESNFNAKAISSTKDYGLMQINICNHDYLKKTLGIKSILDEKSNIESGIYILSSLINEYKDIHKSLMAYNMGSANAKRLWEEGICTSTYSRDIMVKTDMVKQNQYDLYNSTN